MYFISIAIELISLDETHKLSELFCSVAISRDQINMVTTENASSDPFEPGFL